jgi:SAM-dependent methyltransferase
MALLGEYFRFTGSERVLDIGSQVGGRHQQLLERFPNPANVTAVNVLPEHLEQIKRAYPQITTQLADARALPFADQSFDFVYSNAVLEHVGSRDDQRAMAREIQRVGRSWFVTTPNRWFPFEFHTRLPLVSWLPRDSMRKVAKLWAYSHVQGRYRSGIDFADVNLLAASDLRSMFPTSRIVKCRITLWPETLIAVGPRELLAERTPVCLAG